MSYSIRRVPAATLSKVFVILFSLHLSSAFEPESLCYRNTSDKDANPPFLCQYNVTFERKSDCSASIIEKMVFPHTTGQNIFRDISFLPGLQTVSNVELRRGGRKIAFRAEDAGEDEKRIVMPTVKSAGPVVFELKYWLSNAVIQFTRTCGGGGEEDGSKNIMRWRSGRWDESFDILRVRFVSEDENSKLFLLGEDGSWSTDVSVMERSVNEEVQFYVEETGAQICPGNSEWCDVIESVLDDFESSIESSMDDLQKPLSFKNMEPVGLFRIIFALVTVGSLFFAYKAAQSFLRWCRSSIARHRSSGKDSGRGAFVDSKGEGGGGSGDGDD